MRAGCRFSSPSLRGPPKQSHLGHRDCFGGPTKKLALCHAEVRRSIPSFSFSTNGAAAPYATQHDTTGVRRYGALPAAAAALGELLRNMARSYVDLFRAVGAGPEQLYAACQLDPATV